MKSILRSFARVVGAYSPAQNVLDAYVSSAPSPENAVNIFERQWASQLPHPFERLTGGPSRLFEDDRIIWALGVLGGVRNARVLELGPLEGGHTYMLDRAGAAEILAVEGNTQAYLKCLVVKELLRIQAGRFVCGDFTAYLRQSTEKFDVCVASGVLYHMQNPIELIQQIAKVSDRAMLWTHYYDADLLRARSTTAHRVVEPTAGTHAGFPHQLFRYEYGRALNWAGFCGGSRPFAHWLRRDDILNALKFFGFTRVEVGCEQLDHPHGPAFAIVAQKA